MSGKKKPGTIWLQDQILTALQMRDEPMTMTEVGKAVFPRSERAWAAHYGPIYSALRSLANKREVIWVPASGGSRLAYWQSNKERYQPEELETLWEAS